jgi:hypothetical protein
MKNVERSRIRLLAGVAALVVTSGAVRSPAWSQPRPEVTVYKSPT